jgi:hypothetical protein
MLHGKRQTGITGSPSGAEDSFLRRSLTRTSPRSNGGIQQGGSRDRDYTGGESARIIEFVLLAHGGAAARNTGAGKDSSNYYGGLPWGPPVLLPTGRRCGHHRQTAFPSSRRLGQHQQFQRQRLSIHYSPFAEPEARRAKGPDRRWPSRAFFVPAGREAAPRLSGMI